MKNLYVLCFLFTIITSCSNKSESEEITFGFLIHSLSNSRWQMDINYIEERSAEKGMKCIVKNADGNESLQVEQAKELIEEGVDAIAIVAANQNTAARIVRLAKAAEIPIIAYDRLILNCDLDYLISFDYYKVGELMTNYACSDVKSGNIILLYGDAGDANAVMVKDGIERALEGINNKNQYNIVFKTYVEGWSYENAKHVFSKATKYFSEDIDIVIACNTPLALATSDVLEKYGLDPSETIITSQDLGEELIQSIKNNKVNMSVVKPLKELAFGVVDLVEEVVTNNAKLNFNDFVSNNYKDVEAKLFTPFIVDKTNVEKYQSN